MDELKAVEETPVEVAVAEDVVEVIAINDLSREDLVSITDRINELEGKRNLIFKTLMNAHNLKGHWTVSDDFTKMTKTGE